MPLKQNERISTIPYKIKKYLLQNSQSASFIMNFPKVFTRFYDLYIFHHILVHLLFDILALCSTKAKGFKGG